MKALTICSSITSKSVPCIINTTGTNGFDAISPSVSCFGVCPVTPPPPSPVTPPLPDRFIPSPFPMTPPPLIHPVPFNQPQGPSKAAPPNWKKKSIAANRLNMASIPPHDQYSLSVPPNNDGVYAVNFHPSSIAKSRVYNHQYPSPLSPSIDNSSICGYPPNYPPFPTPTDNLPIPVDCASMAPSVVPQCVVHPNASIEPSSSSFISRCNIYERCTSPPIQIIAPNESGPTAPSPIPPGPFLPFSACQRPLVLYGANPSIDNNGINGIPFTISSLNEGAMSKSMDCVSTDAVLMEEDRNGAIEVPQHDGNGGIWGDNMSDANMNRVNYIIEEQDQFNSGICLRAAPSVKGGVYGCYRFVPDSPYYLSLYECVLSERVRSMSYVCDSQSTILNGMLFVSRLLFIVHALCWMLHRKWR